MNRRTFTTRTLLILTALVAALFTLFVVPFHHSITLVNQPDARFQLGDAIYVIHKTKTVGFGEPTQLVRQARIALLEDFPNRVTLRVSALEKLNLWVNGDSNLKIYRIDNDLTAG